MNHPARPAPEGATSSLRFTIIALLADERRGCDHKHLDDLLGRYAALRARCERLEGAQRSIARAPAFDANTQSIVDLARAVLAQPEDGK